MNFREWFEAARRWYAAHSARDRRIMLGVLGAIGLSVVYVAIVEPLRAYRRGVAEEIVEGQEELKRASRFLAAADTLRAERDDLRQRLDAAKQRLLPGGSGTLGAAALQERANAIAAEKGITIQSTQVMREEPADPFRKVSVRLTLSGELKPFSEFVSGLEHGQQHLTLPFVEVSRRGAVAGAKGPRTLSATVEVSGYLMGSEPEKAAEGDAGEAKEGEAGEGEVAGAPEEQPLIPPSGPGEPAAPAAPPPAPGNAAAPAPPPAVANGAASAVAPPSPLIPPAGTPSPVPGAARPPATPPPAAAAAPAAAPAPAPPPPIQPPAAAPGGLVPPPAQGATPGAPPAAAPPALPQIPAGAPPAPGRPGAG